MNTNPACVLVAAFICLTGTIVCFLITLDNSFTLYLNAGYTFGQDLHGCYERQRQAIDNYGPSAPLYYWFPKCLPGGYFQVSKTCKPYIETLQCCNCIHFIL